MCDEINPEALLGINLPEGIFFEMSALLETEITEGKAELDRRFHGQGYSREKFRAEDKLRRKRELADQMIYLRTADGKWQAEEIGKLCKVLLDQGGLEQEDWKLRKQVLADMAAHDYYGSYGCYEPVFALSERLCTKPEEYLEYAEILENSHSSSNEKRAAYLYLQYGRGDKYAAWLEQNLWKSGKRHAELIAYYEEHGRTDDARRIAEQCLKNCRDELTDAFIFLLRDARKNNETEKYQKLYASAKRRKGADFTRIYLALETGR